MDASTVDAVADALRALLRDPAFQRLDGSFAAAFEDEHASAAQERFEATRARCDRWWRRRCETS